MPALLIRHLEKLESHLGYIKNPGEFDKSNSPHLLAEKSTIPPKDDLERFYLCCDLRGKRNWRISIWGRCLITLIFSHHSHFLHPSSQVIEKTIITL
jgi:hypothetical protein